MADNWATVGWWPTTNTRLAAAMSVMGIAIRTEAQLDELTGTERRRLFLSLEPVRGDAAHDMYSATRRIVRQLRDGTLERDRPMHPVLIGLAALSCRSSLLAWMKAGKAQRLRTTVAGWGIYGEAEPGDLAPVGETEPLVGTPDLSWASAAGALGIPVRRMVDTATGLELHLAAVAQPPAATTPWALATGPTAVLMQAHRAGELAGDHPLRIGLQAITNYQSIIEALRVAMPTILLRRPSGVRSAVVRPDITGRGLDHVRLFFRG
jgi:hypothetical protein